MLRVEVQDDAASFWIGGDAFDGRGGKRLLHCLDDAGRIMAVRKLKGDEPTMQDARAGAVRRAAKHGHRGPGQRAVGRENRIAVRRLKGGMPHAYGTNPPRRNVQSGSIARRNRLLHLEREAARQIAEHPAVQTR